MRETGIVRKRFFGDKGLAQQYTRQALTLMGKMKAYLGPGISGSRVWRLGDGTIIKTIIAGTIQTVEIFAQKVKCIPIVIKLHGFGCIPHSSVFPAGPFDPGTPDEEHPDYPEVVVTPFLFESALDYLVRFYNAVHKFIIPDTDPPVPVKSDIYRSREIDTCMNRGPWYPDGVRYGWIDWRGPDEMILSWTGSRDRYTDGPVNGDHPAYPEDQHGIFYLGKKIFTNFNPINGVCVKRLEVDGVVRYRIFFIVWITSVIETAENFYVADFNINSGVISNIVHVSHIAWRSAQPWLFNESATAAVSVRQFEPFDATSYRETDLVLTWADDGSVVVTYTVGESPANTTIETTDSGQTTTQHTQSWNTGSSVFDNGEGSGGTGYSGVNPAFPDPPACFRVSGISYWSTSSQRDETQETINTYRFRDYDGDTIVTGTVTSVFSRSNTTSPTAITTGMKPTYSTYPQPNFGSDQHCVGFIPDKTTQSGGYSWSATHSVTLDIDGLLVDESVSDSVSGSFQYVRKPYTTQVINNHFTTDYDGHMYLFGDYPLPFNNFETDRSLSAEVEVSITALDLRRKFAAFFINKKEVISRPRPSFSNGQLTNQGDGFLQAGVVYFTGTVRNTTVAKVVAGGVGVYENGSSSESLVFENFISLPPDAVATISAELSVDIPASDFVPAPDQVSPPQNTSTAFGQPPTAVSSTIGQANWLDVEDQTSFFISLGVDYPNWFNYLTNSDPVVETGLPGENPRFDPIGVI